MIILRSAIGNKDEAYVEESYTDGINIIFSDENNKGKTIVIQSMMYALGNRPIFPESFEYKRYIHYIEFEHEDRVYRVARHSDSFVIDDGSGLKFLDGISEFKRFWHQHIFMLPQITLNGVKRIVDLELFIQLFFIGQDGKDTSNIFNSGFYHKEDFKNMLLSYAGEFELSASAEEIREQKKKLKELKEKREEYLHISDFYKTSATATEYLSHIKDKDAFEERVAGMETIQTQIAEIRKKRSRIASRKALWNGTLKELNSLNRTIEVGELRCMDCNSNHIAYKGNGKATYSFDVSTQEMRSQIIASIRDRIDGYNEEIEKCSFDIEQLQKKLTHLMEDEEVTIENIVAYKQGFHSAEELEEQISRLDEKITVLQGEIDLGIRESEVAADKKKEFLKKIITRMNGICSQIDIENAMEYTDLFTKRGSTVSGSEMTVFYASRLIAIATETNHVFPLIMDSFRAEDLSSEKEKRLLQILASMRRQCILTTTLKTEEHDKYQTMQGINSIDYTGHTSNKILQADLVTKFRDILQQLQIQLEIQD